MKISMYQSSVPVFIRMLNNLSAILEKAAAHAEAKKITPSVLINSRLYPDMLPFVTQIFIATDTAKGASARLAGMEPPKFEDNEATFPELVARIKKTVDFLSSLTPEQIDGSDEKTILLPRHNGEVTTFQGLSYLQNYALPNFYFHVTTAYAILRHNGIEIGKQDYLGKTN
ncbi:MAG: DUF1993 domain-containing protein [SAR324 cluster bacterium]|nr:DUF1993 domain-containing protein [SAR324 cluster bacterium]MBF0353090.1 DUF1993 domain-containing protein [SAR324 cluster bacterium]